MIQLWRNIGPPTRRKVTDLARQNDASAREAPAVAVDQKTCVVDDIAATAMAEMTTGISAPVSNAPYVFGEAPQTK